ncbi:MAG: hypothetical protein ABWJ42_01345 [Sulfolobales archaeon]
MNSVNATSNIKTLLSDFLVRYGERGRAVLEACLRAYERISLKQKNSIPALPGDFDYRTLVEELGSMGYSYNPSPILRILEREYGLIRTTLHTSRQRWFVFSSKEVVDVLNEYILKASNNLGEEDPELLVIKIQLLSLRIDRIKEFLTTLSSKDRWSEIDYERLRKISLKALPQLLRIYRKLRRKDDETSDSLARELKEIFNLLNKIVLKASKRLSLEERRDETIEELERDLEKLTEGNLTRE